MRKTELTMSIQEIKQAVADLPRGDLASFRQWSAEFDAKIWDVQFEQDAKSGKLDKVAAESVAEFRAGKYKELSGTLPVVSS
jgi:hypothetical protein